jgi:hypothetical protein
VRSRRKIISTQELQDRLQTDPELLLKIITNKKMRVYRYNPDTKPLS